MAAISWDHDCERTGQIAFYSRPDYRGNRPVDLERVRPGLAWPASGRHPLHERQLQLPFPGGYLLPHQRAFDLLALVVSKVASASFWNGVAIWRETRRFRCPSTGTTR